MRYDDVGTAAIGLDGLRYVLKRYPLWAIEEGCLLIQGGEAFLDGKRLSDVYPPNDAQVRRVVAEIVKPYIDKRDNSAALLAAPVETKEPDEPKPTLAELKEKYGRDFGMEAAAVAFLEARATPRLKIGPHSAEELERLASLLTRGAVAA